MQVLSVTSEYYPLIKTGGLADVAGALPAALAPHGVKLRTLLPAYPAVLAKLGQDLTSAVQWADLFGGPARLLVADDLLLLDAPHLYARDGNPYLGPDGQDWPDNAQRFAALSWAGYELAAGLHTEALGGFRPALVHGHDWQAGLLAAYLHHAPANIIRPATILTIHNLAFQGLFDADLLTALRLPAASFAPEGLEYYGWLSFLKAGLYYSDALTTVSPTYAQEIQSPAHGMGMDGLLRRRSTALTGIVNGLDTQVWDPASDAFLVKNYQKPAGKAANKAALQTRFGLEVRPDVPLLCVVSRLTRQKGLDLLLANLPELLAADAQLAVLGSGDGDLEAGFRQAAADHPAQIACQIGYDEALAHQLQAGADGILVPSRFEPCGLTQLSALRYGTVPVVARVGGLADTVIDANPAALQDGVATGVQFLPVDQAGLAYALQRFLALYADPKRFNAIQTRAMGRAVGWPQAAAAYVALYERLVTRGPAA